jgi:RNA polymerase sigma-70 factor (ECF subfamily)
MTLGGRTLRLAVGMPPFPLLAAHLPTRSDTASELQQSGGNVILTNPDPYLDDRTRRHIRAQAHVLQDQWGTTNCDAEDFEQEIALRVLKGMKNFDSRKSPPAAFKYRQVKNAAADIAKYESAQCRHRSRRGYSLDQPIDDDEGDLSSRHEIVCGPWPREAARQDGHDERLNQRIDFGRLLYRISPEHRDLLNRICRAHQEADDDSLTSLARALNVSRTTLYRYHRQLARELYKTGIGDYVGPLYRLRGS